MDKDIRQNAILLTGDPTHGVGTKEEFYFMKI
jgi:hypothetical protein